MSIYVGEVGFEVSGLGNGQKRCKHCFKMTGDWEISNSIVACRSCAKALREMQAARIAALPRKFKTIAMRFE